MPERNHRTVNTVWHLVVESWLRRQGWISIRPNLLRAKLTLITILTILTTSCKIGHLLNHNVAEGRGLVLAINVYSQDAIDRFPDSLDNLVSQNLLKSVPKCQCRDGKARDFIYISGFSPSDGNTWAILATPLEMDTQKAIIFRADATPEIVTKSQAAAEMQKSRDYLLLRDRKVIR